MSWTIVTSSAPSPTVRTLQRKWHVRRPPLDGTLRLACKPPFPPCNSAVDKAGEAVLAAIRLSRARDRRRRPLQPRDGVARRRELQLVILQAALCAFSLLVIVALLASGSMGADVARACAAAATSEAPR